MLERYLAELRGDSIGAQRRGTHIGLLNRFFAAVRQHSWDTDIPALPVLLNRNPDLRLTDHDGLNATGLARKIADPARRDRVLALLSAQ